MSNSSPGESAEVYVPATSNVPKPRSTKDVRLLAGVLIIASVSSLAFGAFTWRTRAAVIDLPAVEMTCDQYLAAPPSETHHVRLTACVLDLRHWMGIEYNGRTSRVCGALWGATGPEATSVILCTNDGLVRELVEGHAGLPPESVALAAIDGYGHVPAMLSDPKPDEVAREFDEIDGLVLLGADAPSIAAPLTALVLGVGAAGLAVVWLVINGRRRRQYEAALRDVSR